jgi:hypothetical protein
MALRIFSLVYDLMGMTNELLKIGNIKFWYGIDHKYTYTLHIQQFMSQQLQVWQWLESLSLCATNFR